MSVSFWSRVVDTMLGSVGLPKLNAFVQGSDGSKLHWSGFSDGEETKTSSDIAPP